MSARRNLPRALGALTVVAALHASGPVRAEPAADAEAASLYSRASELGRTGHCSDAIVLLERSYALVQSPNSALLLARCTRDVGRFEEAYRRYETAIDKAEERVAAGELRYSATATSARDELGAMRKRSGQVVVRGIPAAQHLEVNGMRVEPQSDGSARVRARLGSASIKLMEGTRTIQERVVDVKVEQTSEVSFTIAGPPPPPAAVIGPTAPPPAAEAPSAPLVPIAIGAGVVGALGFGSFAFFGLRSQSAYSSLEQCSPTCGDDRRAEADRGAREQTFANVGLVVGIVGVVVAGTLLVLHATR